MLNIAKDRSIYIHCARGKTFTHVENLADAISP